jgi:hypothetical protein
VKATVLGNLAVLWLGLSWLAGRGHSERSWWSCLLVGALSTVVLLVADVGHAIAHVVSARHAGAPMDEILIAAGMPRTLYKDNDVPPSVHRMRALGGPVFSAVGLLVSLLLRAVTPGGSLASELATWSSIGHGFILAGSLLPLPFVDGGTILKWTLVERGRTPAQSDTVVQRLNTVLGIATVVSGAVLLVCQRWLYGLALVGVGAIAIGSALGKIR